MIAPDNFRSDPLGYLGNQGGHIGLGLVVCYWLAYGWQLVAGELPPAWVIGALWAGVYLGVELPQGGGLWDTVEDVIFAIGYPALAVVFLAPSVMAVFPDLLGALSPALICITVHLCFGAGIRAWRLWRNA